MDFVRLLAGCVVALLTVVAVVATVGTLAFLLREPSLPAALHSALWGYIAALLVLGWRRRVLVLLGRAPKGSERSTG